MNKKEIKQWLRTQIDSSLKVQSIINKNVFYLLSNNSYVRALKLSKINGKPVNKNDFTCGEKLFCFHTKYNSFLYYPIISDYLKENYSTSYYEQCKILEEVFKGYDEYKEYKCR